MSASDEAEECPTCGATALYQVRRDVERGRFGIRFVVHGLDIEECRNCGEVLFGPEAMERIEAAAREMVGRKAG